MKVLREVKILCPLLSSVASEGPSLVASGNLTHPQALFSLFAPILLGGASAAVLEAGVLGPYLLVLLRCGILFRGQHLNLWVARLT